MNCEVDRVRQYYDCSDEEKRFQDPRKRIEFINTCRILKPYIIKNCKVLDCAAGTGAYEDYLLACNCKHIVASDLSPRNVGVLRKKYAKERRIEIYSDNVLDLSRHKDNTFDIVLCLGPMYHLRPELGRTCLKECIRVLKRDGCVVVAYKTRHFMLWNLLNNPRYNVSFEDLMYLMQHGHLPGNRKGFLGCSYFSSPKEMIEMAEVENCSIIDHRSVDLELGNFYEKEASLTQKELDILSDYLFEKSGDERILGASKNNLIILKKN